MKHNETRNVTLLSRIVNRIILLLYRWKGWKIEGHLPQSIKKYVIAGAPHTSNWDFVFFAGATKEMQVQPNFMGKHTLFQGIMKNFMLDMGGISVDRTRRANTVEQMKEEFARRTVEIHGGTTATAANERREILLLDRVRIVAAGKDSTRRHAAREVVEIVGIVDETVVVEPARVRER